MENLEEMDRFLEKFNLLRLNQEEIEIMNNLIQSVSQFSRSVMFDSLEPMNHSTPGLPVHHQLPEFTQIMSVKSVMPSSHLTLCRPLLLLPTIPPSIRVFSNESTLRTRWPKHWSFSFSISPSKEHPGLTSSRMDGLVGSPCSPKDSQESSPTPQFKGINSLVLSFLHSPTLTSIHHHWKNHSLD